MISLPVRIFIATFLILLTTYLIIKMYKKKNIMEYYSLFEELQRQEQKDQPSSDVPTYASYRKAKGYVSIKEGLDIGKDIENAFKKPFKPVMDFIDNLTNVFNSIPERVNNFGRSFDLVGKGIEKEFQNLGVSLKIGFTDVFDVIGTAGTCTIKTLTNLRSCMIWYVLDCIGTTLYNVFIELPIFIIKLITNYDLQPYVTSILCYLEELDAYIYNQTCFHIIHYPDWVIEACYSCKIDEQINKLQHDFKETIPQLMKEPNDIFHEAGDKFKSVFS